jgi:hypothetical protein
MLAIITSWDRGGKVQDGVFGCLAHDREDISLSIRENSSLR